MNQLKLAVFTAILRHLQQCSDFVVLTML